MATKGSEDLSLGGFALPGSGPQKRKSGVSLGCGGCRTCVSAISIVLPEGWARSAAAGKASASPGTPELTAACPLTQLPPPQRERVRGGGEAWYKVPQAQPARSLSIFRQYRAHPPGEYSALGQDLVGRGRARWGESCSQPGSSPRVLHLPPGLGGPGRGEGFWDAERLVRFLSAAA